MRTAIFTTAGGPEVIAIKEVPRPTPKENQALVKVRASGLNRAEILQRKGYYPAPPDAPSDIPGLEFAGVIEEIGKSVKGLKVGQKVFGITSGGC